jgi:hypothetical protein
MQNQNEIRLAFEYYFESLNRLKKLEIIKNQKDFTSQLGEWVASLIYEGKIAENGKQKDWDLKVGSLKYQIKTAAKSITTNRKDCDFKYSVNAEIDYVVIIVFDENYKIEKIYKVPFKVAYDFVNRKNKNLVLKWSVLDKDYSENLEEIYKRIEILKIFKKI